MKYMMLMIPQVYQPNAPSDMKPGPDFAPPADAVAAMTKYNEDLAKAGVLRDLNGLHPPEEGARIAFRNGKATVTDGPYIEAKEVLGGYWIIEVGSMEEAVEWAKRCPVSRSESGDIIEIRQIQDVAEWPEEVRKAAESPIVTDELERHRAH